MYTSSYNQYEAVDISSEHIAERGLGEFDTHMTILKKIMIDESSE